MTAGFVHPQDVPVVSGDGEPETFVAVASAADISRSSLGGAENAVVRISPNTVKALLDAYGVTGDQRDALLTLAREANRQGWWHAYGDVPPEWFEVYIDLEGEAETLSVYDNQTINGLVQTEDYARTLLSKSEPKPLRRRLSGASNCACSGRPGSQTEDDAPAR